ncbi:hypothetical protein D3C86_2056150 [compost metagenome]
MVSSQDQQHRIFSIVTSLQCRQSYGWRCITAYWLKQNIDLFHPQEAHLLGCEETVLLIADQPW